MSSYVAAYLIGRSASPISHETYGRRPLCGRPESATVGRVQQRWWRLTAAEEDGEDGERNDVRGEDGQVEWRK